MLANTGRTQYFTNTDLNEYSDNMTITCRVMENGSIVKNCEVAAFDSKGELRGSALSDPDDGGIIYLTIQGEGSSEPLSFRVVYGSDDSNRKIAAASETYTFKVNAIVGTYSEPFVFTLSDKPLNQKGDVNLDGKVDIADVSALISMILGKTAKTSTSDVNGDGKLNITDISTLVKIILGK